MFKFFNTRKKNKSQNNIPLNSEPNNIEIWKDIFDKLKSSSLNTPYISASIPVNQSNFGHSLRNIYKNEIYRICLEGKMYTRLYLLKSGVIYLMYCIEEGDHGDSEGFGVEPDTWIFSYVETNGDIIVPFELDGNELLNEVEDKYGSIWIK